MEPAAARVVVVTQAAGARASVHADIVAAAARVTVPAQAGVPLNRVTPVTWSTWALGTTPE